jgi:hypothetical protein
MRKATTTVVLAMAILGACAPVARAQIYTVMNHEDSGVNGDGSLRGELKAANEHEGPDTIVFTPGLTGTITLSGSGLQIEDEVDIEGPEPGQLTVAQSSAQRVIHISPTAPGAVTIAGLHIADGTAPSSGTLAGIGGDIVNGDSLGAADLTLIDDLISDGAAAEFGGGIASYGPLTLRSTTVSGNHSGYYGGGIETLNGFTIQNSTISGNSAPFAAGLYAQAIANENALLESSTISRNSGAEAAVLRGFEAGRIAVRGSTFAANEGRGVEFATTETASTVVVGSTIADNDSPLEGGGMTVWSGGEFTSATSLEDTIVAANTGGASPDISGTVGAAFSLIGSPAGATLTETVPSSDLIGIDPRLGPLADNGGPTETMALPPTSPAVDKGSAFGLSIDQRGDPRPVLYPGVSVSAAPGADGADIGAYELQAPAPVSAPPSSLPPPAVTPRAPRVRVNCPKSAKPSGCKFSLQVFSAKPPKPKGKGTRGRAGKPVAESAVAKVKLALGKSALVTLRPKPKFATRLDAVRSLLVREVETVKGRTRTSYRRLKVVG